MGDELAAAAVAVVVPVVDPHQPQPGPADRAAAVPGAPVISFHTASGTAVMTTLAPAPTAWPWAGGFSLGRGAPAGSATGVPGGRLSMTWASLRAPSTQASRPARACQRVSVRGATLKRAIPSAPVRTRRSSRQRVADPAVDRDLAGDRVAGAGAPGDLDRHGLLVHHRGRPAELQHAAAADQRDRHRSGGGAGVRRGVAGVRRPEDVVGRLPAQQRVGGGPPRVVGDQRGERPARCRPPGARPRPWRRGGRCRRRPRAAGAGCWPGRRRSTCPSGSARSGPDPPRRRGPPVPSRPGR